LDITGDLFILYVMAKHTVLIIFKFPLVIVKQLHREFLRAGSTVMQTFTFYASEDKLGNRGNEAAEQHGVNIFYIIYPYPSFVKNTLLQTAFSAILPTSLYSFQ